MQLCEYLNCLFVELTPRTKALADGFSLAHCVPYRIYGDGAMSHRAFPSILNGCFLDTAWLVAQTMPATASGCARFQRNPLGVFAPKCACLWGSKFENRGRGVVRVGAVASDRVV